MIRSLIVILALLTAPLAVQAQGAAPKATKAESDVTGLSVGTTIGFASSVPPGAQVGFNWTVDAMYRMSENVSIGAFMQVIPVTGVTAFSMTGEGRYHFTNLNRDRDGFLGKITPYAGLGVGFTHFGGGLGTGFLISLLWGAEYELSKRLALTSDMRFNINAGGGDEFHFTWQMIGARVRF